MSSNELDCCIEEVKITGIKSIDDFYREFQEQTTNSVKTKKVRVKQVVRREED